MKKEFIESLKIAISLDTIDFAKSLFSSPSGFFIKVNNDKFAKIQGRNSIDPTTLGNLVVKPPVEYYLSSSEFHETKSFASGMGCGVNRVGKLSRIDINDKVGGTNFINAMNNKGMEVFEIRSPSNSDISKLLAANTIRLRKVQAENFATNKTKI